LPDDFPSGDSGEEEEFKSMQALRVSRHERNKRSARNAMRDKLVMEHLPLVKAIAIRLYESLPVHADLDDLIHAGMLGLIDGAEKFDERKHILFKSYAKHRIKGAMLDSLRQLDWASRDLRRRHKQLEAITHELAALSSEAPNDEAIAGKMGVDVDRWRQIAIELRMVGLLSSSSRPTDDDNQTNPEFAASEETQPDMMYVRNELSTVLNQAMQCLPERYQTIVSLYYSSEMTMREIGEMLGINESRVSQIHKTALEKMAAVLQSAGIHSSEALV
jgi:RNA polymerase sigma factor for flagellar operon FliA